jgi:mRNA-degrading endonuclease RelE of RelBE toxin-antitoxin system
MAYGIDYTESAFDDLASFTKYERVIIVTAIDQQLSYEPLTETRNRKPLRTPTLSAWELRVGAYRIFYDVEPAPAPVAPASDPAVPDAVPAAPAPTPTVPTVIIRAIGWKDHNILYLRGKAYSL